METITSALKLTDKQVQALANQIEEIKVGQTDYRWGEVVSEDDSREVIINERHVAYVGYQAVTCSHRIDSRGFEVDVRKVSIWDGELEEDVELTTDQEVLLMRKFQEKISIDY